MSGAVGSAEMTGQSGSVRKLADHECGMCRAGWGIWPRLARAAAGRRSTAEMYALHRRGSWGTTDLQVRMYPRSTWRSRPRTLVLTSSSHTCWRSSGFADVAAIEGLRERNKQRRTELIIEAGLRFLRENPDQQLTIDRVAVLAGVSPMTVFNLLGTRQQLWNAMTDRALQELDVSLIAEADPERRAHKIVDEVVRVLRSDAAVFRALLSEWAHSGWLFARDPAPN